MERSAQRKLAVACLGVSIGALVLDRTVLRDTLGPQSAQAAVASAVSSIEQAPRLASATERAESRVAEHLRRVVAAPGKGSGALPDVFDPSLVFGAGAVDSDSMALARQAREEFAATHKLTAVVLAGDGSIVMLEGLAVRLGETVDKFRLVAVQAGMATFESDAAGKVDLIVPTPDNAPRGAPVPAHAEVPQNR